MNKQIEEIARVLCNNCAGKESPCSVAKSVTMCIAIQREAEALYNAGYRKQSEGENVATYPSSAFECSNCHWQDWDLLTADSAYNFCPNCGAKMKGEGE